MVEEGNGAGSALITAFCGREILPQLMHCARLYDVLPVIKITEIMPNGMCLCIAEIRVICEKKRSVLQKLFVPLRSDDTE